MRVFCSICLFFLITVFAIAQEQDYLYRGSIPEDLLRPGLGESPRYPLDTVIGELGRGEASAAAFSFANYVAAGLLSGRVEHPALVSVNLSVRNSYISAIERIAPRSFRLGGGREAVDGAVSFLIRFIGSEYGITGEMYIRYVTRQVQMNDENVSQAGSWVFEELLLEEAKSRDDEQQSALHRLDYLSYEKFF